MVSGQCLGDQQSLLLQLKNSLRFDPIYSKKLVHWSNKIVDCCSWEGVTCSQLGHVVGLDLSNESISGGLDNSSSLFSLGFLQSLNLADNKFSSSEIPDQFMRLKNLSYLNLSTAGFLGFDPVGISHLTRLVALDLSSAYVPHINMYFHLATLVQNLSEHRELYLDGVLVLEEGSGWCQHLSASLPNLSVLSMKNCGLSGPLDSCFSNLPKSLSVIRLDGNMFSAPVPEFFADFKNLASLSCFMQVERKVSRKDFSDSNATNARLIIK